MATVSARRVKRDAAKAADKLERKLRASIGKPTQRKLKGEAAKETPHIVNVARMRKDSRYVKARDTYRHDLAQPNALLAFMSAIVAMWASGDYGSKWTKAHKDYAKVLAADEQSARLAARKANNDVVTKRDAEGVSRYEFAGVLKFAQMSGSSTVWTRIVKLAGNWTYCKVLANKARTYANKNGRWPTDKTLSGYINERNKARRVAAGDIKGKRGKRRAGRSATSLVDAMLDAAKKFRTRFGNKLDCMATANNVVKLIGALGTKAQADKKASDAKADKKKAKKSLKRESAKIIDFEEKLAAAKAEIARLKRA